MDCILRVTFPAGNQPAIAQSLTLLADYLLGMGGKEEAVEYYEEALGIWHGLEMPGQMEVLQAKLAELKGVTPP